MIENVVLQARKISEEKGIFLSVTKTLVLILVVQTRPSDVRLAVLHTLLLAKSW